MDTKDQMDNEYKNLYKIFLKILKDIHEYYYQERHEEHIDLNSINDKLLPMMISNGCKFVDDDIKSIDAIKFHIRPDVSFILVYNMIGNEICKYFDYINTNGMKYIIIFAESFKGIFNKPDEMFGRSNYIDILVTIIELYVSITTEYKKLENDQIFSSTAAANNYRLMPTLMAYAIIKKVFGKLNENDVYGYDYKDLMYKLDNFTLDELFMGIRLK